MSEVHHDRRGDVAVLTMNRPVANVLAHSLRAELLDEINTALSDTSVSAIVLTGAGNGFSTGVDIMDYEAPVAAPWIGDLCQAIETAKKPVVAALHGEVLSGGLELALASHARVAARGTHVGMPEIHLGLIPNGGATQRLPRLLGAQVTLSMLMTGQTLDVSEPKISRLTDGIVDGSVVDAAVETARKLAQDGQWGPTSERSSGLSDPLAFQSSVNEWRAKVRNPKSAEADIITCVEAAQLLPFSRGVALETVRFNDRRKSIEAQARRHFQVAERRALIFPEKAQGRAANVREVMIPGSCPLVTELAIICLDAGVRVSLMSEDAEVTEALRATIDRIYSRAVQSHAVPSEKRDDVMARIRLDSPERAIARADLVLDTGQFDLSPHHGALNPVAFWVCTSNTEEMPKTAPPAIQSRHLDMRVYRPALGIKLAELCVPPGAHPDTVVSVAGFLNGAGRTVIRCECIDGMIGGNLSAALYSAALALAKFGVGPYRVDAAARALGFVRGPFLMMDEEGLPAVAERLLRRKSSGGPGDSDVLAPRIAAGATGRAAGRGFYRYDVDGIHFDPDLKEPPGRVAQKGEPDPRAALEAALANEATRLINADVVQRASDIDVVMVRAFGFDANRGGPLFQADLMGMLTIYQTMKHLSPISEPLWHPQPNIEEMVKNGTGFFGRAVRPIA